MKKSLSSRSEQGQVLLSALTIATLVLLLSIAVLVVATAGYRLVKRSHQQAQTLALAEAGIDYAIRQLNLTGSYPGDTDKSFGNGTFTVTVTGTGDERTIESTGFIPNSASPRFQRTVRVQANVTTTNVEFFYGIQVDEGGLSMGNNSQVLGNIYTNGSITGGSGAKVTGDAIVAGGASPTLDQQQEDIETTQEVGRTSAQADIAQSFVPSTSNILRKVSVHLAKVGSPANIPLRILSDNGNKPSKTELASTVISSASVGASGSWIDASFATSPNLSSGTRYWIALDGSANNNDYYLWSKDTEDEYPSGKPMASPNWNTGNPVWTDLAGDLAFRTFMGGQTTLIDNVDVDGTARANTLKDMVVGGDAYFQTLINTVVNGVQFPGSPDPAREELPLSDGVIEGWKQDAQNGGIHNGDYTLINGAQGTLGPLKITGNLVIDNLARLTLTGGVWVVGNVVLSNNCIIQLDPSYGPRSAMIVTDGTITINNNCQFLGSGDPKSYVMVLSAKNAPAEEVISVENNSAGVIYYAGKGRIRFRQRAQAKEATAYGLTLEENAAISYESGLANTNFSSGSGGSWRVVAGSWQEIK